MTGSELRSIRKRLGMAAWEFGYALGYEGERKSVSTTVSRVEARDTVPGTIAVLAGIFSRRPDLMKLPQKRLRAVKTP